MKPIISQFTLIFLSSTLLLSCAALKTNATAENASIQAEIDLISIADDKVKITIMPPAIKAASTVFYIPQIVPGTYEYSNFGRFIENFEALDKKGNPLEVNALDQNSWEILNPKKLAQIRYLANDTFDGPDGQEIYPMGGTDFQEDEVYLLNLHSMIGYFEGMKARSYKLSVRSPKELKPFTSLPSISSSDSLDIFNAERYFHIIDNPILYSKPNAVSFDLDDIKVGLAVYSPSDTHQATAYQPAIEEMMKAQKAFLGDANDTPSYDVLLHLMDMEALQYFGGMMGALEHHTSTTVVFVDAMSSGELTQSLVDVVSHEFFHTLTPLNVHSEEIHNFEYNRPLMSQHLWMYEGTTEYFANLFQINQGLIDAPDFYNRMMEKINLAQRYDDSMSFTEMSAGIVEEPYQANYGNVYQKGALINMCLDILIREQSGGDKGILWVMQNLAQRYGKDKPFKDEELIAEIVALTYPVVGAFFETHVQGTTPIDYNVYFEKVGLISGQVEVPLRSILFAGNNQLFFASEPNEAGVLQFAVKALNPSLEAMGIQVGDLVLGIEGELFPEINQENGAKINEMLTQTLGWEADQEVSFTLSRNGETLVVRGKVGNPTTIGEGLLEEPDASDAAVALRNAWLFE